MLKPIKTLGSIFLAALCVAAALAFGPVVTSAQEVPEGAVVCADAAQLEAAFLENSGQDIVLSDDVFIAGGVSLCAAAPVTVYMQGFSIFILGPGEFGDGGWLELEGPITFTGTGATNGTLFMVQDGAGLYPYDKQTRICAAGDNICAITIDAPQGSIYLSGLAIEVTGEGSSGIMADVPSTELSNVQITAAGGAVSVRHTGNVQATLCRLTNQAEGPVFDAMGGDGRVVNYCSVLAPQQAGVHNPPILSVAQEGLNRFHVEQGDEEYADPAQIIGWFSDWFEVVLDTSALPDELAPGDTVGCILPTTTQWDLSEFENYSVHTPGVYTARGSSSMLYDIPGVVLPQLTAQVIVVPSNRPWIMYAIPYDWAEDNVRIVQLQLISHPPDDADIKLWVWRQTESGWGTPEDLMAAGYAEKSESWEWWPCLDIFGLKTGNLYRFQLEITPPGQTSVFSNIMELDFNDRGGGDRDLGDRDPGDWTGEEKDPDAPGSGTSPGTGGGGTPAGQPPAAGGGTPLAGETKPANPAGETKPADPAGGAPAVAGTVFGRQQLLDLLEANPLQVTLFCGTARVVVGAEALQALLGSGEQLAVQTDIIEGERLVFIMYLDGAPVGVPGEGVQLLLPYTGPGGEVFLQYGDERIPAVLEGGVLTATVFATGEYQIVFAAAGAVQQEGVTPAPTPMAPAEGGFAVWLVAGVAGGLAVLSILAVVAVRRVRRRARRID